MIIPSIFIGSIFLIISTYAIFNKINFYLVFITLFIITSPIQLMAFTYAWLIKYYLYGLLIINVTLSLVRFQRKDYLTKISKPFYKNFYKYINLKIDLKLILFSIGITLLLTYKGLPNLWRFEAHDMIYYSWLNEIFKVDYAGPLRWPTAFPYTLGANHLTAGSILSPFLIFERPTNMFSSYCVKYFLVFITFLNFIYNFFYFYVKKQSKLISKISKTLFAFLALFFFYTGEIDYSLAISNYTIIITAITLGSFILKEHYTSKVDLDKRNSFVFIGLIFCLLISKATTFPVFVLTNLIIILHISKFKILNYLKKISFAYLSVLFFLLIVVFLSWIVPQTTEGSISVTFPLCIFDSANKSSCLISPTFNPFYGYLSPDYKVRFLYYIFGSSGQALIPHFIYIWFLIIFPCFISGYYLNKKSSNFYFSNFGLFTYSYSLATSFVIVFLRQAPELTGGNFSHAYTVGPIFTILSLLFIYLENEYKFFNKKSLATFSIFLLPVLVITNYHDFSILKVRNTLILNSNKNIKRGSQDKVSLKISEVKKFDENFCTKDKSIVNKFGYYLDKNSCGGNDIGELKLSLEGGKRSDVSLRSKSSIIPSFTIKD